MQAKYYAVILSDRSILEVAVGIIRVSRCNQYSGAIKLRDRFITLLYTSVIHMFLISSLSIPVLI